MLIQRRGRTLCGTERKIEESAKPKASLVSFLAENYSGTEQCSLAPMKRKESVNPL
jgi:hypothetical protein